MQKLRKKQQSFAFFLLSEFLFLLHFIWNLSAQSFWPNTLHCGFFYLPLTINLQCLTKIHDFWHSHWLLVISLVTNCGSSRILIVVLIDTHTISVSFECLLMKWWLFVTKVMQYKGTLSTMFFIESYTVILLTKNSQINYSICFTGHTHCVGKCADQTWCFIMQ